MKHAESRTSLTHCWINQKGPFCQVQELMFVFIEGLRGLPTVTHFPFLYEFMQSNVCLFYVSACSVIYRTGCYWVLGISLHLERGGQTGKPLMCTYKLVLAFVFWIAKLIFLSSTFKNSYQMSSLMSLAILIYPGMTNKVSHQQFKKIAKN